MKTEHSGSRDELTFLHEKDFPCLLQNSGTSRVSTKKLFIFADHLVVAFIVSFLDGIPDPN